MNTDMAKCPEESPKFELFTTLLSSGSLAAREENDIVDEGRARHCEFYMLTYHHDRILAAADHFGWTQVSELLSGMKGLSWLENTLRHRDRAADGVVCADGPTKIKVLVTEDGNVSVQASSTDAPPHTDYEIFFPTSFNLSLPSSPHATDEGDWNESRTGRPFLWTVHVAAQATQPSPFTRYKTTHRPHYDLARTCLPPPGPSGSKTRWEEVLLHNASGRVSEGSITTPYFFRKGRWVTPPLSDGGNMGTTRRWTLERGVCVEEEVMLDGEDGVKDGEEVWLSNGVKGFGLGRVVRSTR